MQIFFVLIYSADYDKILEFSMFASVKNNFLPPNNAGNDYESYVLLNLSKAYFGYKESSQRANYLFDFGL